MKSLLFAVAGVAALAALYPATVNADETDKKTRITVNETILIPGRELPPGKYVIKLDRSASNRNIVRIFNDEENQIQATIIAIPNYRVNTTDNTVLQYWETPAGSPPALRAWFAPGDNYGQEFAYPKEMAERIARQNNNAQVASYADDGTVTSEKLDTISLSNVPEQREAERAAPTPIPVAPSPRPQSSVLLAQAQPAPQEVPIAQNTPQPQPVAPPDPNADLPATASPMGWILLSGFAALGAALMFRVARHV
jgi:hypothetical protein